MINAFRDNDLETHQNETTRVSNGFHETNKTSQKTAPISNSKTGSNYMYCCSEIHGWQNKSYQNIWLTYLVL